MFGVGRTSQSLKLSSNEHQQPIGPSQLVPETAWWLYVLECRGGVLYTGIAKDVDARFAAHVKGTGASFTRMNKPIRIVARVAIATRGEALSAEYALKQMPHAEKLKWCEEGLDRFIARMRG